MRFVPMPWRYVAVFTVIGASGGAIFGFVRGLDHTPTLGFAIVEGTILFSVPAFLLATVLAAVWTLAASVHRRLSSR